MRTRWDVLRFTGFGALMGLTAALAITYLPIVLGGSGFYEHTDTLVVFAVVLAPLGAGIGALSAIVRGRAGTAPSGVLVAASVTAFAALLVVLWQMWAALSGAPSLF
jgi:hypothetical protein